VIEPVPFAIPIPVPDVNVADTGAAPVLPIRSCPFNGAVVVSNPAVPLYKNALAVSPEIVREEEIVTEFGSETVIAPVEEDTEI
jgi:hypothetical protein